MRRFALLLSLVAAPLGAQDPIDESPPADALAIERRRFSSNVAIVRRDSVGFAAILAEGVVVVTSASVRYVGRETYVASMVAQFRSRPDVYYRRTPDAVRVFEPWGMASEEGRWVGGWTEPDGRVSIAGKYFAKWRKVNGEWYVESETYVPDECSGSAYCQRAP